MVFSTFRLRRSQACAAFMSLAAHAAIAVAAAHYETKRPGGVAVPLELELDPPVVSAREETDPVLPNNEPAPRSVRVEHRAAAGALHAAAAAPRVLVAEPPQRPTFAMVLGDSQSSTGGLSTARGTEDGLGAALVRGSGGQAEAPSNEGNETVSDAAVSQHARMVSFAKPAYPPAALAQGIEVSVSFEIVVDRQGNVVDARVVHGAGYGFEESALRSLRSARLTPAMRNGHPVRVRMPWVIDFRIE